MVPTLTVSTRTASLIVGARVQSLGAFPEADGWSQYSPLTTLGSGSETPLTTLGSGSETPLTTVAAGGGPFYEGRLVTGARPAHNRRAGAWTLCMVMISTLSPAEGVNVHFTPPAPAAAIFPGDEGARAAQDLLPLPVGPCLDAWSAKDSTGGWFEALVCGVNTLGGRGARRVKTSLTKAAAQSLDHLLSLADEVPEVPSGLLAKTAVKELLGSNTGYVDENHKVSVAGKMSTLYRRGKVSLPPKICSTVALEDLLTGENSEMLKEGSGLVLPRAEREEFTERLSFDARLKSRGSQYGGFLGDLYAKNLIEVGASECMVTPFFVPRKDGLLRMILDARAANCCFSTPPYTLMCSAERLADLDCSGVSRMYKSQGDISVCFYQMGLPEYLRIFFGLPAVAAKHLPRWLRRKLKCSGDDLVGMRLRVVPMGWSWAVWFVHGYLTSVLERSLPGSPGLYHLLPCPPLSTEVAHKVGYIDNFGGVSGSESLARQARDKVLATLTADGVVAVVEDDADPLLGCQLTKCGRGWMPVAKRFWKCAYLAAELGWGKRRFTGLQVATALGHINSIFLLQRPLFAIFSKAYVFASHYEARCRYLWPSVREEFRLAWMMLPAARSSCGIPWNQCVSAVDASLHGFGLCETQCSLAEVMSVGLVSERCRFRGLLRTSRRPRDSAVRGEQEKTRRSGENEEDDADSVASSSAPSQYWGESPERTRASQEAAAATKKFAGTVEAAGGTAGTLATLGSGSETLLANVDPSESPAGGAQVPCLDAVPEAAAGGGPSVEGRLGTGARPSLFTNVGDTTIAAEVDLAEVSRMTSEQLTRLGRAGAFPEVPMQLLDPTRWQTVMARRWRRADGILVLEAEAALVAARRVGKSAGKHGSRHLILGDNMSVTCAVTKGRAHVYSLLCRCRELAGIAVATNSRFVIRWIASELNPADEPSRRYDPSSAHYAGRYFAAIRAQAEAACGAEPCFDGIHDASPAAAGAAEFRMHGPAGAGAIKLGAKRYGAAVLAKAQPIGGNPDSSPVAADSANPRTSPVAASVDLRDRAGPPGCAEGESHEANYGSEAAALVAPRSNVLLPKARRVEVPKLSAAVRKAWSIAAGPGEPSAAAVVRNCQRRTPPADAAGPGRSARSSDDRGLASARCGPGKSPPVKVATRLKAVAKKAEAAVMSRGKFFVILGSKASALRRHLLTSGYAVVALRWGDLNCAVRVAELFGGWMQNGNLAGLLLVPPLIPRQQLGQATEKYALACRLVFVAHHFHTAAILLAPHQSGFWAYAGSKLQQKSWSFDYADLCYAGLGYTGRCKILFVEAGTFYERQFECRNSQGRCSFGNSHHNDGLKKSVQSRLHACLRVDNPLMFGIANALLYGVVEREVAHRRDLLTSPLRKRE